MALHYIDNLTDKVEQAKNLIGKISSGNVKQISIDTETTGLDPYTCELLLVQIAVDGDIYVMNRGKLGRDFFINLVNLINKYDILCIGHNIKFDAKVLRHDTGVWLNNLYDTMVTESILTAGIGDKMTSLLVLVERYCGIQLEKSTRLEFISLNQNSVFTDQQINYAATDVLYVPTIFEKQTDLIGKSKLDKILQLERDVLFEVAKMEYDGVLIDAKIWAQLTEEAIILAKQYMEKTKDLIIKSIDTSKYPSAYEFAMAMAIQVKTKKLRKELESITDAEAVVGWVKNNFNLGSHKQLLYALNLIGIECKDTNEKTLNKLDKNEVIDTLLEFREYEKLISTYGYNIIDLINPVSGRIHTDYWTLGTVTGRFSSSNPNLQNIPPKYRKGFIAKPGYSFIAMDYSQQEYRLAGALSGEPKIIEAYQAGFDMHTATAAIRFNKEFKDVTSEERKYGKTMNFAVLYGTTEYGLMRNFSIKKQEALDMLDGFYKGYPRLTTFKEAAEKKIMELGYSITPMGRRRYFRERNPFSTPFEIQKYESQMKREGFNMIIQGGGADVTKLAMIKLGKENPYGDKFKLILQTHDEIVAEVADEILEEATAFMKFCMESVFQPFLGEIPALVDKRVGKNWGKD